MFGLRCKNLVRTSATFVWYVLERPNPSKLPFLRYISSKEATDQHSFTVSYLINSWGLSPESALRASKRVHITSTEKADSVLSFFKNHSLSRTQISNVIKRSPNLLLYRPQKTILPKLEFFYSKGLSSSEVARIVSNHPSVLCRSLNNIIIPNFNRLKELLPFDDKTVIKRCYFILDRDIETELAPKINFLLDIGVRQSTVLWLLSRFPATFTNNLEKFKKVVDEIKEMGFNPSQTHFVKAVAIFSLTSLSVLERKFDVYKSWGWSQEEIIAAFRKQPMCLGTSEAKVMENMDLFVNKLGWESSYIAKNPTLVSYSLKKRLIPRVSILQFLLSKGKVAKDFRCAAFFHHPEAKFLQRFVTCYVDSPELLKLYRKKLTQEHQ